MIHHDFHNTLEQKVRAEARHGWDRARKQWDRPLPERVLFGRAIGWLRISSVEIVRKSKLVHFHPSAEDMAIFREGDQVRLSQNDPDGGDFIEAMFLGLTENGLSVTIPMERDLQIDDGWTLDETMIDLSDFYLKALDEMATTSHGRDVVLPALLHGVGDEVDFEAHADFSETLEDVAVIDETSQMRVEAAIMPMLRAQRWFFFGDRQQLPPVVQRPIADAADDSVFANLAKHGAHTMLKTTYPPRLNVAVTRARTKVVLIHSKCFHGWLVRNAAHDENAAVALSLLDAAAH